MQSGTQRRFEYFLTYSGVKLPLNLVSPIAADALENRNTYIRAGFDADGRLVSCEKVVYGEVELRHDYDYRPDGYLARARISMDDEETEIVFDENGRAEASRTL
jgi:hypothetical protein